MDGAVPPLGEFGRIARYLRPLAAGFPGALALRDDAALVDVPVGQRLVVTTDGMVAGVHFLETDPPGDVAAKLLRVNLSDLAAKGATPLAYSLVTELPARVPEGWLAAFCDGLADEQRRWDFHLLGGDSVRTTGDLALVVSALGLVPADRFIPRGGAHPGDEVFVTGTIGDAALGLRHVLDKDLPPVEAEAVAFLVARLRRPTPRLAAVPMLRVHARAAVDVSDGLVADLGHVAMASGVRIVLEAGRVPLSAAARAVVRAVPELFAEALTGGDDYEIAFTAAPGQEETLRRAAGDLPVTRIGRVIAGPPGVTLLRDDGQEWVLNRTGWQHF